MTKPIDELDEILEKAHAGCQIIAEDVYDFGSIVAKKELLAWKKAGEVEARIDELKYLLEDFGIEDNIKPIKDRIKQLQAEKEGEQWSKMEKKEQPTQKDLEILLDEALKRSPRTGWKKGEKE